MGHLLMENHSGRRSGVGHREAALGRQSGRQRVTLGADEGYDTADFVAQARAMKVTSPRTPRAAVRRSTVGHPGYAVSLRIRKRGVRLDRRPAQDPPPIALVGCSAAACNLVRSCCRRSDHGRPERPQAGQNEGPRRLETLVDMPFYTLPSGIQAGDDPISGPCLRRHTLGSIVSGPMDGSNRPSVVSRLCSSTCCSPAP